MRAGEKFAGESGAEPGLKSLAVVLEAPGRLSLRQLDLEPPGDEDVVVAIEFSGISTGTERLLWTGKMPAFPGMGYPLVPGYESVGRIVRAGPLSDRQAGQFVFVPGARCYGGVRGLFGGASSLVVLPGKRTQPVDESLGGRGVLLALAATAYNAIRTPEGEFRFPDLIVGHGVLGRLLARVAMALGGQAPVVWEIDAARCQGAQGYQVIQSAEDGRSDYQAIYDVSGAAGLLDSLIARLGPGGEVVLAGFYDEPLQFSFPPAFMRRARIRVAAEWQDTDLAAVNRLVLQGDLTLDGLITACEQAEQAQGAYERAFEDPDCLKMILDWRAVH